MSGFIGRPQKRHRNPNDQNRLVAKSGESNIISSSLVDDDQKAKDHTGKLLLVFSLWYAENTVTI